MQNIARTTQSQTPTQTQTLTTTLPSIQYRQNQQHKDPTEKEDADTQNARQNKSWAQAEYSQNPVAPKKNTQTTEILAT